MKHPKVIVAIAVILLGTILFGLLFPRISDKTDWKKPPAYCFRSIVIVKGALYDCQADHAGHLPSRLSELVPNYVSYDNIQLFFWPQKPSAITNLSLEVISKEIDDDGIFSYLGEAGFRENLIVYVHTNLWSKMNQGWIVDSNFQAQVVDEDKLLNRMSRLRME